MTLCGVGKENFKFSLKNSLMLAQRRLVFVQSAKRWTAASSSRWQKGHPFLSALPKIKNFYLNTTHCVILCIENFWINRNDSVKTVDFAPHQSHTNEVILKVFLWGEFGIFKENWKGKICLALSFSKSCNWLFLIKWWFRCKIFLQLPLSCTISFSQ